MHQMQFTKDQAAALAPVNWTYSGFSYATGRYAFQRKTKTGFAVMVCEPCDMTAENLAFMAKHKLTREMRKGDLC